MFWFGLFFDLRSVVFSELCCVSYYLLYVFPVVLFIIFRGWIKIITLLYCVTLDYDMIKLLVMRLIFLFVASIAVTSVLWKPSIGRCY